MNQLTQLEQTLVDLAKENLTRLKQLMNAQELDTSQLTADAIEELSYERDSCYFGVEQLVNLSKFEGSGLSQDALKEFAGIEQAFNEFVMDFDQED